MSCCQRNQKNKSKTTSIKSELIVKQPKSILKKRRSSIHPNHQDPFENKRQQRKKYINENKEKLQENIKQRDEFTKRFLSETIQCGGCSDFFALGDAQLTMNCASCNKFFHCKIAGRCIGKECEVECDGEICKLGYCLDCVNTYLPINLDDSNDCICKSCEKTINIPNLIRS